MFAAGMLRPAFDVLAAGRAGEVLVDYANARDLAGRIVGGEQVDVFASASPAHPRGLRAAGLVTEPVAFASNRLVVAVPVGSPATDHGVLRAPGTRVVIEVEGIPLGDYTRELLGRLDADAGERHGDGFSAGVLGNVVLEAQTVFEVADALIAGEADAGVLYATDVAAHPGRLRAIELPVSVGVTCVACVVESSTRPAAAAAWIDELLLAPARAILRGTGFGPQTVG
ncbi:MAG TPA: molybdate ABC transporter substrate-binding protein [Solirubrobacteraceae bacterium]|nr:molybdate ABC transporter substrate-binding protein [Solirubrobacteraceae bacterium]